MNPWTQVSDAAAAYLATIPMLAPIPILTPDAGDLNDAIDKALAEGGLQPGTTNKIGLCFAITMMAGRSVDENVSESQDSLLHLELIANPELNSGELGHQLVPLDVFWAAVKNLISWNRGPGLQNLRFSNWDMTITKEEVTIVGDFALFQVLDLD